MTSIYTTRSRSPALLFPTAWYYYYLTTDRFLHDFGVKFERVGTIIENDKRRDMYYPLGIALTFQENFIQKLINDKHFLDRLKKQICTDGEKLLSFIHDNEHKNVSKLSNEELFKLHDDYCSLYTSLNYPAVVIVVVGIEAVIRKVQKIIGDQNDLEVILKPTERPYLLEYELDILKANQSDIESICNKWWWIPFDYHGEGVWGEEYFKTELSKPKDEKRSDYLENYHTITQNEQQRVLKKYTLNAEDEAMVQALPILSFIQDERKRITNISYPFLQRKIFDEFAKRLNIDRQIVWLMTPNEIHSCLSGEKKDYSGRKQLCVLEVYENRFVVHDTLPSYITTEAVDVDVRFIKGVVASKGKVEGRVRLCVSSKDTLAMEQGEILVASATTPDFIIGFKKALAVITDEGGLTSHAAIVSREMHLPCIIGTKIATKVLKDGDLVEVDANNGVVRILKK